MDMLYGLTNINNYMVLSRGEMVMNIIINTKCSICGDTEQVIEDDQDTFKWSITNPNIIWWSCCNKCLHPSVKKHDIL